MEEARRYSRLIAPLVGSGQSSAAAVSQDSNHFPSLAILKLRRLAGHMKETTEKSNIVMYLTAPGNNHLRAACVVLNLDGRIRAP
ncbi:hypothetical protein CFRS1_v014479 [Colletotrichum fructicola]|nr:hypothetical protein CFRS1_v014479 [Colletotrichum fructicola]